MTDQTTRYLRNKAALLRARTTVGHLADDTRGEYLEGARQLEIAADEIDAGFHIDDEDDV